jgi:hypothetical protein
MTARVDVDGGCWFAGIEDEHSSQKKVAQMALQRQLAIK